MKAICLTYWRVPFPSSRSGLCTNINMDGMVTITKSDFFAMLWNQIKCHLCIHSEHFGKGFCCRHKQVVPDQQNSFIYQANGSEKCYLYEIPSMHALTHHGSAEASHSLTLFIIENCQMAITHTSTFGNFQRRYIVHYDDDCKLHPSLSADPNLL
jgi:hypothetical protein